MSRAALQALAWLSVLAFGAMWAGAHLVLGWPLWLVVVGAFISGIAIIYAAEPH